MNHYPITIEALQVLDAIDRRGSFAKAAEELNKVTSALSYSVQKLEEQLDLALFQRQGRRSVLTPAGRLLLDEGRLIMGASAQLAERAKELASGWEPKLRIGIESSLNRSIFFEQLAEFLEAHNGLEVDICECILNGGWEALEQDKIDLMVGIPGPVPQQKGYRSAALAKSDFRLVIAASHPQASKIDNAEQLPGLLPKLRRVIAHDTSKQNILRSEGLSVGQQNLYVQTIDQKHQAILAGLGIGHLPYPFIKDDLARGNLLELTIPIINHNCYIAWKSSNKGRALQALAKQLAVTDWAK